MRRTQTFVSPSLSLSLSLSLSSSTPPIGVLASSMIKAPVSIVRANIQRRIPPNVTPADAAWIYRKDRWRSWRTMDAWNGAAARRNRNERSVVRAGQRVTRAGRAGGGGGRGRGER